MDPIRSAVVSHAELSLVTRKAGHPSAASAIPPFPVRILDHLGSAGVAMSQAQAKTQQGYDPWGKVRAGGISATSINFTGQRLDGTGLLYYHARLDEPDHLCRDRAWNKP